MRKSTTNRRAIVPECMITNIMPVHNKQQMKRIQAQIEHTTATYLAKQRYTTTMTAVPVFQATVKKTANFNDRMAQSSFKQVYERVQAKQQKMLLQDVPKTPEEHNYATNGIIF
jgi:hypothetical protein